MTVPIQQGERYMPTILAIETATEACSAALLHHDKTEEIFALTPRRHAEVILPFINQLLEKTQINLQQVDAIACGAGPGSFMGVRLANAVAQSIAFAANKPIIPISTLQILAQTVFENYKNQEIKLDLKAVQSLQQLLVSWDARMHGLYWGAYQLDSNNIMQSIIKDQLSAPENIEWPKDLKTPALAAGNGWQVYRDYLSSQIQNQLIILDQIIYPKASALIQIALQKYQKREWKSPLEVEPIYLRNEVAKKMNV